MKFVISILILSILVIGQCRDIKRATGGNAPMSKDSERVEVCIDQHLGCFPETEPGQAPSTGDKISDWWDDTFWRSSRDTVGTEFRFWVPNANSPLIITNGNFHNYITENSGYDPTIKVFFIIHGFHGGDAEWAVKMKDALMERELCYVFIVDWSGGDGLMYGTAAANTWVVGAEVGRFIERIGLKTGLKLNKVHIIGHSLGAHASGFAGKWLKHKVGKKVARITGLDPAGKEFYDVVPGERLDRGDAEFVDVIHTNWATNFLEGLGIPKPIGHFDFYPNGGEEQPGCPTAGEASGEIALETLEFINPTYKIAMLISGEKDDISDAFNGLACAHGRAIQFFIESINSRVYNNGCNFFADQCPSWQNYSEGKCPSGKDGRLRVPMGYNAKKYKKFIDPNASKTFYLRTRAFAPFCIE